jgi:hypothetical protein
MSNTLRWLDQLRAGDVVRVRLPEVPISTIHPSDIADVAVPALTEDGHARITHPPRTPHQWTRDNAHLFS